MKLRIIGGCPRGEESSPYARDYVARFTEVAQRADRAGWDAILVYSDNRLVDPWLVAQEIIKSTQNLAPLIAVQPVYMHPFTVAKLVTSLAFMHGRSVYLNMVAGGFPKDLKALDDHVAHDDRYSRVIEYTTIVRQLLHDGASTFEGRFYKVTGLSLSPALSPELRPLLTMSGSSPASIAAARALDAVAIQYLRPAEQYAGTALQPGLEYGTRLGIIARDTSEEAWSVARTRYPEDPKGQAIHKFATRISDSVWVKELGAEIRVPEGHPYWLGPYRNYQAFCPFLVGSREEVVKELGKYIALGYRTFLVEPPADSEDSEYVTSVFRTASEEPSA